MSVTEQVWQLPARQPADAYGRPAGTALRKSTVSSVMVSRVFHLVQCPIEDNGERSSIRAWSPMAPIRPVLRLQRQQLLARTLDERFTSSQSDVQIGGSFIIEQESRFPATYCGL